MTSSFSINAVQLAPSRPHNAVLYTYTFFFSSFHFLFCSIQYFVFFSKPFEFFLLFISSLSSITVNVYYRHCSVR
ncbi:hypothetical protein K450DRAFT_229508 [Umbelopsis ramanniana AG]|uniref:Uncharacterized protein n=1 Tax=Umbelopsis ramanniana AG TaxID=1314678 RepID=A0AAD5HG83_UMBRA|nr:uncharacterized protein K450DRAFT_229508 [Umbelopsis ramanniana AG]KAI8581849.1 hypothetical protein K450DRAFT_229508 [Umbelopsis ramanniana AG]